MQYQFVDNQPLETSELLLNAEYIPTDRDLNDPAAEITQEQIYFQTHFEGEMEMFSDAGTVAEYLDAHEGWFCRCAQPMKAEPLGKNGYTLIIGRFGSFGYEVEPKIGVEMLPPQEMVYKMRTVPVPDYHPPGYDVDYHASMSLVEKDFADREKANLEQVSVVTQVEWQLHLKVAIRFPKFIYKLPRGLIQKTGDRLLAQIVRQISPRLTQKVQQDFHDRLNLPLPDSQFQFRQIG
ncbi:DUF1997 domain-containing protein [Oscillatoria salina]|uniref:DUF1997 domain-containing protein n=1 Tax=Oscillatoria salina TaxID=331517 RepID=UPI0013B70129|nr:DUF1997 domain-containing protein [Oscillatoria salina]MBZ8180892.1 DUF1997 domain-containing protein [Oscillatoria salina IIICB1]NET90332.1 DUF1997 domain-containing protein [Kamptonema sp. SIO1D9]